jgi:mRNA deadenylase 3'-5' endonuclease subunit Ccr4
VIDNPGHHFLLANSHFFGHPKADLVRLIQAIVSIKYIEQLKLTLTSSTSSEIKRVGIIFGGDLNTTCKSKAFKYILKKKIPPKDDISKGDY